MKDDHEALYAELDKEYGPDVHPKFADQDVAMSDIDKKIHRITAKNPVIHQKIYRIVNVINYFLGGTQ